MILRLARFCRLWRLLRLGRTILLFDSLRLIVGSIKASLSFLMWSIFLLFFIMLAVALMATYALESFMLDADNTEELRLEAFSAAQVADRGDRAANRGAHVYPSQSLSVHMFYATTAKLSSMHSHGWQLELKTGRYHLAANHVPSNLTALPMTPLRPAGLRDEVAGGEPAHRRLAAARW